jgi:hypothetical protein
LVEQRLAFRHKLFQPTCGRRRSRFSFGSEHRVLMSGIE